jgi:predicted nucleic acid-binding protein
MKTTTLILDSSIIVKWFFSENASDKALLIKDQFVKGNISIVIPLIFYYEINNVLKTATKKLQIEQHDAIALYDALFDLNFITYSTESLFKQSLELALKYDISSYDASYVALAEYLQVDFVTADKKLINKVSRKYIFDLEEF